MGIFDIFSNSDAQNAAAAQQAGYLQGFQTLASNINQANASSGAQYGQGQQSLQTGAANAGGALTGNYGNAQGQLAGAYGQGANALNQNYAAALQPFQQNYNAAAAGQNQLGNLLGLNGPNGSAQAQQTLQNMPGYQFALNQGTQNVLRNQAATGQLNSGATNMDLNNYAQGQASQNYNNYVSQLQPYLGAAGNAASGIGGVNTGLGNQLGGLYQGLGQGQAGISTGLGGQLANNYNALGQNLNANQMGLGNIYNQNFNTQGAAGYGTYAGIGNAQANADYANLAQSGAIFGGLTSLAGNALGAFKGAQTPIRTS